LKKVRRRGGNIKIRAFNENQVGISNPVTGKTEKTDILRVVRNPANVDYDRRGVITKGTIVETKLGLARVTSRPGQHGLINAILLPKESKS
jgi:small subunit ribosomal protein S8e